MITGLHKTEMMLIDPYSTYYQKIFDHLINSSIWILAGYGGLDPHINSCIARARKIKSERNDKFQIIISDYCKDIEQKLRDSTYLTSKVSHLFWPEWERVLKLGTAKSSEDLIFKLNHDIYGAWLNDKEILMFDFEGIETFSHKLPSLIEKLTLNN
jgi:hypothetical protein